MSIRVNPSTPGAAAINITNVNNANVNNVKVNSDGIQISRASAALNQLSAARSAKLQELAPLVQAGDYRVSSPKISYAIVGYALV